MGEKPMGVALDEDEDETIDPLASAAGINTTRSNIKNSAGVTTTGDPGGTVSGGDPGGVAGTGPGRGEDDADPTAGGAALPIPGIDVTVERSTSRYASSDDDAEEHSDTPSGDASGVTTSKGAGSSKQATPGLPAGEREAGEAPGAGPTGGD